MSSEISKKKINDCLILHIKEEWKKGKITGTRQDPPVFIYYGEEEGKPRIMQVNFMMVQLTFGEFPNFASTLLKSLAPDLHFGCIDKTNTDEKGMPRVVIIRKERCR